MMGKHSQPQNSLFYVGIDIENRVRARHPLRKIRELIDFDFAYSEVKDCYGHNGNVSVPPPVILKLMLLLIFYNVRSEREPMDTLPEHDILEGERSCRFPPPSIAPVIPSYPIITAAWKTTLKPLSESMRSIFPGNTVSGGPMSSR